MWNLLYDGLLRETKPAGVEVLVFTDDLALVATAKEISVVKRLLEAAVEMTILWLQEVGLEVAIEKSEAIVFTNRKTQNTLAISLRGTRIESKESIKYLEVHLDPKLNYSVHAKIAIVKATTTTRSLGRIIPNVGASKTRRRRLLATVITSQTLYGYQIWADKMSLGGWENLKKSQKSIIIRVTSAYRTVASDALNILSGIPPIDLQATERIRLGKKEEILQKLEKHPSETSKQSGKTDGRLKGKDNRQRQ